MAKVDKYDLWHLENYFKEQLLRELSQMFKWENLPKSIPEDYLERTLVRNGYALFYYDERIGEDVLRCTATGYNRHNQPTEATTYTPNTSNNQWTVKRRLKRLSDGEVENELFNKEQDGVLLSNMEYNQNMQYIVDFYAKRLAQAQKAFDNSLVWSNIPYIFLVSDGDKKLSLERMFESAQEGKPFIITDKTIFEENKDRAGVPTSIPFIGKELMDAQNEIMMKFRETVGFDTAGVDKAERVNTLEIKSNDQHTFSVLQIMLKQRQMACESINEFFGLNITVDIAGKQEIEDQQQEGAFEDGGNDGGTKSTDEAD